MGNCLKTQLKEVVANSNLKKLGMLKIHHSLVANKTGKLRFSIAENSTVGISVDTGYTFTVNNGSPVASYDFVRESDPIEWELTFGSGDYNITINNKYLIVKLGFEGNTEVFENAGLSVNEFKCCDKVTNINLSSLKSGISGNVVDFPTTNTLVSLQFPKTSINGTLENLGKTLHGPLSTLTTLDSGITGDVVDFINAQVDLGKTSVPESNAIRWFYISRYKFNGFTMSGDYGRLVYDGKAKVVIGTDQPQFADCLNLYEKGYSASEIAVWNAAGKTVTDVVSGTVYPPTNQ